MKELVTILLFPFYLMWLFCKAILILLGGIWSEAMARMGIALAQKSNTHGDADWASAKTLKKHGHYIPEGWLVGVHANKRLFTLPESSAIGISAKRQGKSLTAIAQLNSIAMRERKDDVVVVDPAGDIHAGTVEAFRSQDYHVKVIDFTDPMNSDSYDVLSIIDTMNNFDFDRQVEAIGHLVMPDDKKTTNDHFQEFARILFTGFLAHSLMTDKANTTLAGVVDILTTDTKRRNEYLKEMKASSSAIVRQAVSAFDEAGDKEKGSFSTTMARKLKVWLRQAVRALTADDGMGNQWTWEDIYTGDQPTIVYVITGLGTDEGSAARLILGNAINARRYLWNRMRRKPPRDLRLLVDESREIGYCNAVMDANNELAKAGVTVMMWWLSARDIYHIYGDDAQTLLQNSDLIVFGGSKEKSFMEDVSWLVGEKTIENRGYSEGQHGESESRNEQARRVIKGDEIRRLGFYDSLVVMGSISVKAVKVFSLEKGLKWL